MLVHEYSTALHTLKIISWQPSPNVNIIRIRKPSCLYQKAKLFILIDKLYFIFLNITEFYIVQWFVLLLLENGSGLSS